MIRPPLEVADIVRSYGTAFVERHRRWLTFLHLKVLRAIAACRTAALGGHLRQCDGCGLQAISYKLAESAPRWTQFYQEMAEPERKLNAEKACAAGD